MRRGMHLAVVATWLVAVAGLVRGEGASVLLEKGIYTQETLGDPSAAIPLFEQALADTQADRQVAAQAHFHLAMCHKALKQDAKARELLRQFVQRYDDQEVLVARARAALEELTEFDPATLMPPDTFVYVELGSPGEQLEKVLKMLEGTPVANPLEVVGTRRAVTVEAPGASAEVGPAGAQAVPAAEAVGTGEAGTTPVPAAGRSPGRQFIRGLLNPSMLKEFKKIRGAAAGIRQMGQHGYDRGVAVLRPGESDAIRGLLTTMLVASGQPGAPIEGMEVVQFEGDAACAFDDEVFIIAAPLEQLAWSVRQYKGGNEASLATQTSFASLAPAASRRHDAVTIWADPARVLEAVRPTAGGGMRDLAMLTALADVPNMEGAVARLRLVDNGATLEATVAYKPAHRSLFYDLIRTPPMSGQAFAAVPPTAAALAGVALQPPGAAPDPSAVPDARTELVRHVTGLDLGRELFNNIQEIVIFLDTPGEGSAEATSQRATLWWELAARSLGVVIVSRDPAQTRAVLDRLLALPETFSGQGTTQPAPDRSEYPLVSGGRHPLTVYLTQQGHTTVLALDPRIRDAAMEALRSGRNARTAGAFAKVLPDLQGDSKVVVVNVGGILRLADAASPPPPSTQPTSPQTTKRQTQGEKEAWARIEAGIIEEESSLSPSGKGPWMTAIELADALGRRELSAVTALVQPGSAAEKKAGDIMTKADFSTFRSWRQRRSYDGDRGTVVMTDPSSGTLVVQLAKTSESVWQVTDVAYTPPEQSPHPTTAPASPPARSMLAQLADAFADTTVRLETVERDEAFTIRLTASDIPPLKDVFPLVMQLQQQRATSRGRVVRPGAQLAPQERNKNLRQAAMDFLAAVQKNDQAAATGLVSPGSPAAGKVQGLLATEGLATFQFQEMRRKSGLGLVLVHATGAGPESPALLFHLAKPGSTGNKWFVIDVESLPVGKAAERIRELAPDVVPVTREDLMRAEAAAPAPVAAEPVPAGTPQAMADRFILALARRDQVVIKEVVLPGSPAEAALNNIMTKDDFLSFHSPKSLQSDGRAIVIAVKDVGPKGPSPNVLFVQLRRQDGDQWRVTNVDYVPVGQAEAEFEQFPSGPLAKRGEPQPKTLQPTSDEFLIALARRDQAAIQGLIQPGSPAQAKVGDILTKADFTTFDVQRVRRSGDLGQALAVEKEDVGGTTPRRALLIRLVLVESAPWQAIWRVADLELMPLEQAQERMREPLAPPGEGASQTSPKMLQPTADGFVSALARRDQDAIKTLILPGSAVEGKVDGLLKTVNLSSLYVRAVRRVDAAGMALAVGEAPADGSPQRALVIRLVLTEQTPERDIWRVTDAEYLPLEQAQLRMAEPLPQPATQPAGAATGVRASPSATFEFHVKGADLRDVLHVLSTEAHKSVVATKEVTGTVTADLYGVTFPQALEAILKAQGFVYREKDGIISVYTPGQLEEVIRAEREGGRTKVVTEVLVPPTTGPSTQPAGARATVESW